MVADICRFCGAVPEAGAAENQAESLVAVKLSEPEPVLETPTEAGAGSEELPCVPLNDNDVGETDKLGGGGEATFNVTVMVAGEPCTLPALTVICPVYVPAAKLAIAAEIWMVCGAVPVLGVTDSQPASLLALKVSVPLPLLFTFAVCDTGSAPPTVALKVLLLGETDRVGGEDATGDK